MRVVRREGARPATLALAAAVAAAGLAAPPPAGAVTMIGRVIPFLSLKHVPKLDGQGKPIFDTEAALDGDGNPIRDAKGNPVFNKVAKYDLRLDPAGLAITDLGADLTFDPTAYRVVTDLSASSDPTARADGFMCAFSVGGSCPSPNDAPTTDGFGDPLPGSTWSFDVDNVTGHVRVAYHFAATPVSVDADTNFFGFTFEPIVTGVVDDIATIPDSAKPFRQHPFSSDQFCITTATERTGQQCASAPEPHSWALLLVGFAGLGLALRAAAARTRAAPG